METEKGRSYCLLANQFKLIHKIQALWEILCPVRKWKAINEDTQPRPPHGQTHTYYMCTYTDKHICIHTCENEKKEAGYYWVRCFMVKEKDIKGNITMHAIVIGF